MNVRLAWTNRWPTIRLVYLLEPRTETGQPTLDVLSVYRDYGVIPKSSRDDNFNRTPADLSRYQVVHPGDVVVNRMKAWQGSLGVSALQGLVSPDYDVLRPKTPITSQWDMRFLHHLLRSRPLIGEYAVRSTGIRPSQWRLYWAQMRMIEVPVPEALEQRAIADYIDRETAKIDTLVEEQLRLIETLRERRESTITTAVTRGLDESAPLVDSGVRSLGAVPDNWRIIRIKNVARAVIGLTYGPENVVEAEQGGTLVLRAGNIQGGRLAFEDNVYVDSEITADLRLQLGDIVICARNGSAKLIGKSASATEEVVGQTWGAFMVVLRSSTNDYLRWVLKSQIFKAEAGLFSTSTINQLTSANLHNLRFALPPSDQQREIADYLDEQTAKIDTLIAETERFIELARERRSALITAAITGQVDARELC